MRCGAKCFHVQMETGGKKLVKPINARTPAEARKRVKVEYGKEDVTILSVRKK